MFGWIAQLYQILETERVKWRMRNVPITPELMNAAYENALDRFPEDRANQQAKAASELFLREVLGRRKFDA